MKEAEAEADSSPAGALVRVADEPPTVLPAVVLDDLVPFPGPIVPILLEDGVRRDAVLNAKSGSGFMILINRHSVADVQATTVVQGMDDQLAAHLADLRAEADGHADEGDEAHTEAFEDPLEITVEVGPDGKASRRQRKRQPIHISELSPVGIVARLVRVVRLPDDRLSALLQLMRRAQPVDVIKTEPFPILRVLYPVEVVSDNEMFEALYRQVRANLQQFFEAHPSASDDLKVAAMSIQIPSVMADFVAQHLSRDFEERLMFLAELDLAKRMRRALEVALRELDLLTVGNRISQEIRAKVEKHQRDFLLREQLKAIRAELGEAQDPTAAAVTELTQKLDEAGLSDVARARADEELKRLQHLPPEAPEHNVVRSYLEWIASLPWSRLTEDSKDIVRARQVLDADHYGLEEVKDRIVEFLAVHQLNPNKVGTLLCFAGPPGVGKTSLGQSIAKALGREFYRFSVGGMRDEAEIKGHRRTYVGAMPGRVLQGLRHVKTANPVFMLDELDKMGSDWRGDPSSALLEVLDPAQNKAFVDHYLDIPFDLSRVMFIATANIKTEIPAPLLDRLEIIDLAGYIPEEKLQIGVRHLVPRQRKEHGLTAKQLTIAHPALKRVVSEYTHEAGVREFDRLIGKICRKRATQIVRGDRAPGRIGAADLPALLGPARIHDDRMTRRPKPGVAVGLAWTPAGGDVLFIESALMPGKGLVKVTGQLGDVMSESANLAISYVRSRGRELGVDVSMLSERDLHLHFPAGAVRKDGPSAGVTVTSALVSLLSGVPLAHRLAMTGELTLRGEVLPVGGIREKVVAARRAGIRTVVLPSRNKADVEEIPAEVREHITFVFASDYDEVIEAAFGGHVKGRVSKPSETASTSQVVKRQAGKRSAVSSSAPKAGRSKGASGGARSGR